MYKKKKNNKWKIALIIFLIFLVLYLLIFIMVHHNKNYYKNIEKKIKKNTSITYIESSYKYGSNYIVLTKDYVIVLNKNYKELLKEDLSKLNNNANNYTLVYKNKKLEYEQVTRKENKITYTYYDAYTYKEIKKIEMEE